VDRKRKERTTQDTKKDLEIGLLVEDNGKVSPDPVPVSP